MKGCLRRVSRQRWTYRRVGIGADRHDGMGHVQLAASEWGSALVPGSCVEFEETDVDAERGTASQDKSEESSERGVRGEGETGRAPECGWGRCDKGIPCHRACPKVS